MRPWFLSRQFWTRVLTPLIAVLAIAVVAMLATDLLLPQQSTPRRATASTASTVPVGTEAGDSSAPIDAAGSEVLASTTIGGRDQPSSVDLAATIEARPSDIGVVDRDGSGIADWSLGIDDGSVTIGEREGDRSDSRFVFDFVLSPADLGLLQNSSSVTLELGLGKIEGIRSGQAIVLERVEPDLFAADPRASAFDTGFELGRREISPTDRSVSFDVSAIVPSLTETMAFRARLAPTIADTAQTTVGIATADVDNPDRRPRLIIRARSLEQEDSLLLVGGLPGCPSAADPIVQLISATPGVFSPLGDLTPNGSLDSYQSCWDPALGSELWRTRPALGSAERSSILDFGSSSYFGEALGPASRGYYRYELGGWEVLALDSTCGSDGCGPESSQFRWLQRELSVPGVCRVAYLNATPAQSGDSAVAPLIELLETQGVEAIITGASAGYRRSTAAGGTTHFAVGSGGRLLPMTVDPALTLEARINAQPGILHLQPDATGLRHNFLTTTSQALDTGVVACGR